MKKSIQICFQIQLKVPYNFVASEHPDLDVGRCELGDGLRHSVLQLVFDSGRSEQDHLLLNFFVEFRESLVLVRNVQLRFLLAFLSTQIYKTPEK